MKILHVVHNFPPEYRGGTESYVLNLSLRQVRTQHKVLVVSGSIIEDSPVPQRKERFGPVNVIRIFKQPADGPYKVWPNFPGMSARIRALIRGFGPDLVHVHHWHHLSDDMVRIAAADRIPVVLTLHDFFALCPRFFRVKPGTHAVCPSGQSPGECYDCIRSEYAIPPAELASDLYQRRCNMSDEVRAASYVYTFARAVADFYRDVAWFPTVPIEVRPIGLLRPLSPASPRKVDGRLKVVTWGGQTEVKGTHLLLEAAARPALKKRIEVHVLGRIMASTYGERLESLAKACGAKLHGFFPEDEKPLLGKRYDLAVFPTQAFETYSIVVDEALAMGMPVIATTPGAQSERIGKAGAVVPVGNVDALADAIESFLDPKTRERAARNAATQYVGTLDAHWIDLSNVYHRLTAPGVGRRQRSYFRVPWIPRPVKIFTR